jgi:hypothetical protein
MPPDWYSIMLRGRLILIFKTSPERAVVHADSEIAAAGAQDEGGHGRQELEPFTSL